jgi:hypothetical protein
MKIKYIKELEGKTDLKGITNNPFYPILNTEIYTVHLDSSNLAHFFIENIEVASGTRDTLMKLITSGYFQLV